MHLEFINEGLAMSGLGMLIIFLVLGIIWAVLEIMKKVFTKKSAKPAENSKAVTPAPAPVAEVAEQSAPAAADDSELIAVIAAAIAASLGTSPSGIRIKSYKRIGLR